MARIMKDSGVDWIGTIPDDWQLCKLKNIIEFKNGYAFDSSVLSNDGRYPVIRIGDIKDGSIDIFNANKIDDSKGLENFLIKDKDILLAMSGATVGKLGYVDHIETECYINQRVGIIRAENSKYIYYYLSTDEFIKYVMLLSAGSAQPNISTENVNNYYLSFPNEDGQKKIVTFLDEKVGDINEIISKTKESIEEYKKYKQAVITEAITQGLDESVVYKETNIDYVKKIPAHWDVLKLRFLGSCQNGISKGSEAFGSGYPFVSYGDVYRNYELPEMVAGLIESTESDRENYSVKYGDVFFTRTSETIEEVGFTSTCLKTIENAVFAGFVIRFRPFNNEKLSPRFSKYYFRSDMHRRFFVKEMNLVTRASLSQELLKKLPVLLPPLEEQEEIADYLDVKCDEIDALIAKKEAFVEEMETYKKSLIYEYVTGKKEVM